MAEFYGVQRESTRETPTMLRVIRICRKCGAKISFDAPEGLCARCVLKTALAMPPDASPAGVAAPGGMDKLSRGNSPLAPDGKKQRVLPSCWESWAITNYWKRSVA